MISVGACAYLGFKSHYNQLALHQPVMCSAGI